MPAISPQRMRDRYDGILAAATRVFAEKGYSSASITDIAQAADISDGLIYKYFENKRDLLENVLKHFYERIIADLEPKVSKGRNFEDKLYVLVSEHLHVFVADIDLCRLFISEVRTASDYRGSLIQQLNALRGFNTGWSTPLSYGPGAHDPNRCFTYTVDNAPNGTWHTMTGWICS